nr:Acetyltransferase (GNAT) domain protein [uncultured bacterium]
MTQEIRQTNSLTLAERAQLFEWGVNIFGVQNEALTWRHKDVHFILSVDGEDVSHVGVLKHEVSVAGERIPVGGVGGVVTIPTAQRRGYARELMSHVAQFFAGWEVDAGLLFCLQKRVPYYGSQGWELVHDEVVIQQPDGNINSPLEVMVLPLRRSWPQGTIELNSLPW